MRAEFEPDTHIKSQAWWHVFVIPVLGDRNRRMPRQPIPTCDPQVPVRDPVSQNKVEGRYAAHTFNPTERQAGLYERQAKQRDVARPSLKKPRGMVPKQWHPRLTSSLCCGMLF